MDLKDLSSSLEVGQVYLYEAVESAWSGQSRIKDFFLIGGGEDDDIGVGIKPIHFHE